MMSDQSDQPIQPENQTPPPVRRPVPPSGQYEMPPSGQPQTPPPPRQTPPPPSGQQVPQQPPRQAAPPEQKRPIKPLLDSNQLRSFSGQSSDAAKQAQAMLQQAGIDMELAAKVLVLAVVSGLLAALLDEILGLPGNTLRFSFGWMIAALNGAAYLVLKQKPDLAGVIVAGAAGLLAFEFWFIVTEIIGGDDFLNFGMNVFKAAITGIIVGLIGYGWVAGLHYLPKDVLSRFQ